VHQPDQRFLVRSYPRRQNRGERILLQPHRPSLIQNGPSSSRDSVGSPVKPIPHSNPTVREANAHKRFKNLRESVACPAEKRHPSSNPPDPTVREASPPRWIKTGAFFCLFRAGNTRYRNITLHTAYKNRTLNMQTASPTQH
jgi:hypothetical protein